MLKRLTVKWAPITGTALIAALWTAVAVAAPGVNAAKHTITVGASTALSGAQSFYAQENEGAMARFKHANATNELNGWKIKYKLLDDAYQPTRNLANVKKLVEQDHVFALVCNQGTPTNVAAAKYLKGTNVPVVGPTEGYPPLAKLRNYFVLMPNYSWEAGLATRYAIKHLGIKKVGILYENDDLGTPAKKGAIAVLKANGMKPVATVPFNVNTVDFSGEVGKLASAGAQAVIIWGSNGNIASALKAASTFGFAPKWFGPFWGADPSTYRLAGKRVDGAYFTSWFEPVTVKDKATRAFVKSMHKYERKTPIGALAENGWSEASLFVEGVKRLIKDGKKITRANLIASLDSLRNADIGVVKHVTFTKNNHDVGVTKEMLVKAANGKFYKATPAVSFPEAALNVTNSN